jgi:hypothetical protein
VVGIRRVVQRLRSSAIFRSAVGPTRDQEFCNPAPKCGGSHVERCVARIEVVSDVGEEK